MPARPGTCDRLRDKALSGDRRAWGQAKRLDCDTSAWGDWCAEAPVSFKSKGRAVEFMQRFGPGCPTRSGPTPAQVAWRERFVAAARGQCGPSDPSCATDRRRTDVLTPQGADAARYGLIEATDLVASHNPLTFSPDDRYPANVQEREYQHDVNEQQKVAVGAQRLNPAVLLHRSPTAVDGPPLVTEDGCALGGNGRSMMLKRAYSQHEEKATAYKKALTCAAPDFGVPPAEVREMREPVLVRFIRGTRCDDDPGELAKAVRRYNEGLTQAIDTRALGVSQARQLSPSSINLFGQFVSGDRSLRDVMRDDPRAITRVLEQDGVITAQNRTRWVRDSGDLTPEAKDQIEAMFVGRVLGSADRIRATSPGLLAKVEKAVPYLTAVAGRNPSFDLTKATQEAVDLVNRAHSAETSVERLVQSGAELGGGKVAGLRGRPSHEAVELARMFSGLGPNVIRDRFKAWGREADFDPSQGMLGSRPPTFEQAFATLTTAPKTGRALFRGTVVNMGTRAAPALARVTAMHSKETPDVAPGKARIEYMTGPLRGKFDELPVDSLGDVAG